MKRMRILLVMLAMLALTACGGGGGGGGGGTPSGEEKNPPTAQTGPNQTVVENGVVTLDASNSIGNIVAYAWRQTGGSKQVVLSDPKAVQTTFRAPDVDEDGDALTFELTVTDANGLTATTRCIVNITGKNDAPTAQAGPDQSIEEGMSVSLDGSNSTDPDNGIAAYAWEQIGGPEVELANADKDKPSFPSPAVSPSGVSLTFRLTVTDKGGLKASDECIVTVTWKNKPPQAIAGPTQEVRENASVTLDASNSTDPDGQDDIAGFRWRQIEGPAVTLSNAADMRPTFTAPNVDADGAALIFELTVTDKGGLMSATTTCIVNVTGANDPPTAIVGPNQTVDEGIIVTLDGTGSTDPEQGVLSYGWRQTGGQAVTLSNVNVAKPTFRTPTVGMAGEALTFELTVTDKGGLASAAVCIINITWKNKPPTAEAGQNQDAVEETEVTLDGTGSTDPDDGITAYLWQQIAGPSVTLSDASAARPKFTAPIVGPAGTTITFRLTVTDQGGLKSSDTCSVTVTRNPGNAAAHLLEDTLYTVYAGIGYMNKDTLVDDEPLYFLMLNDLNTLVPKLLLDTLRQDPNSYDKLVGFLLSGQAQFTYNSSGCQSTLTLEKGAAVPGKNLTAFTAILSVNFNTRGYIFDPETGHPCTYTGTAASEGLRAFITGYYRASMSGIEELMFKDVDIVAKNGLTATYSFESGPRTVVYNPWHIAYTVYYGDKDPQYQTGDSPIPVNMGLLPVEFTVNGPDKRDYAIGGSLTVNGQTYSFTDGFRYLQNMADYIQDNVRRTFVMISLNGSLTMPGTSTPVEISSTMDVKNPIGSHTIVAQLFENGAWSYVWSFGRMSISSNNTTVDFDRGTARITSDLGSWTINNWQDILAPF